jgi:LytS/YehU family sensor histidine kinase
LVENADKGEVASASTLKIDRLSLENARKPFVPLSNELDALTSYLKLQQALSCNEFDYRIDVEDVPEDILIPPMLLQPFAENAIMHGFASQKEKGLININIKHNHNALYCIIEDNGRGFQKAAINNHKQSFFTIINQERLEILSRQTKTIAKLNIVDKKATAGEPGVRVELIVPYQMEF